MYEEEMRQILHYFGISPHYLGYQYLLDAAGLLQNRPELAEYPGKELCPVIAARRNTAAACVNRDIRTIISLIWSRDGASFFAPVNRAPDPLRRPNFREFLRLFLIRVSADKTE